jgi:hypothetical protein
MILSGITPVNLLNHVGSMDDLAVPDRLSLTWVEHAVDPSVWCWDPLIRCGLCDGHGFAVMVDPPEMLLPHHGGGDLQFGD